jgi:hypothetical protein
MYKVGTLVKLKEQCLGNPSGTRGYVYDTYPDFTFPGKQGICIIFPNGSYDGFSWDDQLIFLDLLFSKETDLKYSFTNVMKLSHDFDRGVFSKVLMAV